MESNEQLIKRLRCYIPNISILVFVFPEYYKIFNGKKLLCEGRNLKSMLIKEFRKRRRKTRSLLKHGKLTIFQIIRKIQVSITGTLYVCINLSGYNKAILLTIHGYRTVFPQIINEDCIKIYRIHNKKVQVLAKIKIETWNNIAFDIRKVLNRVINMNHTKKF